MKASEANQQDTKWVFIKKGTCSRTLFYILNREFNHPYENEEKAADPLAGGILQQGYQCGLLWGAVLGVGTESFHRFPDRDQAISQAIGTTRLLIESFKNRAGSDDCLDITEADFKSKSSMAKYMLTGKFVTCFKLADKWAPEAIHAAHEGLSATPQTVSQTSRSCATEVVKRMGGTEVQQCMVAGFAGGMGLSGNGCGALSAAIWMNTLRWIEEGTGKTSWPNPRASETLEVFMKETDYEFKCEKISGTCFATTDDHSDFVKKGGCEKLIEALAKA